MSEFFKNPYALFDVRGKIAIVTGASGAFGMLAARVLAGAGAKLVLTAGKKSDLDGASKVCRDLCFAIICFEVTLKDDHDFIE